METSVEDKGGPFKDRDWCSPVPKNSECINRSVMFDPQAQVKGYLAILNIIVVMMNDSKWLSVLDC